MLRSPEPSVIFGSVLLSFPDLPEYFMTPADGTQGGREVGLASEPAPATASIPPRSLRDASTNSNNSDNITNNNNNNDNASSNTHFKLDAYLTFLSGHS